MDTFQTAHKLIAISNGGKTVTSKGGGDYGHAFGRIGMAASSKKKYEWKLTCTQSRSGMFIGIQSNRNVDAGRSGIDYGYDGFSGYKYNLGKSEEYGIFWGAGDVIEMRVDFEKQEMGYSVNGIDQGIAFRNLQLRQTYYLVVCLDVGYKGDSVFLSDYRIHESNQQNQKKQFDDEKNALKQQINENNNKHKQEIKALQRKMKNEEREKQELKQEEEKKEESADSAPRYKTMRKAKRNYEETTKSGGIKVGVGKIVGLVISGVGAYATGGALLPVLANQLKDAVLNVSWSESEKNEDIVEHFYRNNTYLFIELKRKVQEQKIGVWGFRETKIKIDVEVKWFYFEAANISAKRGLAKLAADQASDALDYVSKFAKKWS